MRVHLAARRYIAARQIDTARLTRRRHSYVLDQFTQHTGPMALAAIKRKHIEGWLLDRMGTVTPNTARSELSIIRTFFTWCVDHDLLRANPAAGVRGPKVHRGLPREMPELIDALLAACPDTRMGAIISLMVNEGLRRAEVQALTLEELDLHHRVALVHGKGSKDRYVAVTPETVEAIRAYLREWPTASGPLIRSYQFPTRPLGAEHIGRMIGRVMYDAGIKDRPHDGRSGHALRHTSVGAMLDAGADLRDVIGQTGHENLSALEPYTRRRQNVARIRDYQPKFRASPPSGPRT